MKRKPIALALLGVGALYVGLATRVFPPADPVPPAHAEQSGTRLKAKYVAGADGSQLFVPEVLHDSQLGVDCAFATATDNSVRCLPMLAPEAMDGWAHIYYRDSECKGPAYMWKDAGPSGCTPTPPKYTYYYGAAAYCAPNDVAHLPLHIFPVGALVAPPSAAIYAGYNGGCSSASGPNSGGTYEHYQLDAESTPASFVAGTAGVDP